MTQCVKPLKRRFDDLKHAKTACAVRALGAGSMPCSVCLLCLRRRLWTPSAAVATSASAHLLPLFLCLSRS